MLRACETMDSTWQGPSGPMKTATSSQIISVITLVAVTVSPSVSRYCSCSVTFGRIVLSPFTWSIAILTAPETAMPCLSLSEPLTAVRYPTVRFLRIWPDAKGERRTAATTSSCSSSRGGPGHMAGCRRGQPAPTMCSWQLGDERAGDDRRSWIPCHSTIHGGSLVLLIRRTAASSVAACRLLTNEKLMTMLSFYVNTFTSPQSLARKEDGQNRTNQQSLLRTGPRGGGKNSLRAESSTCETAGTGELIKQEKKK